MKKEIEEKHKKIIAEIDKLKIKKKRKKPLKLVSIKSNIIGIIILIIGLILFINPFTQNLSSIINNIVTNPNSMNIKIGLGLILIGFFQIFLIDEKTPKKKTHKKRKNSAKKKKILISEKITIVLTIWIILLFFITYTAALEVFFILIFIGTLVTKELTDEFTTPNLKKRLNVFIVIFLIAFIAIISQKIINIL